MSMTEFGFLLSELMARRGMDAAALATALAASRNDRLAQVDPEAASEVLRLLSGRRLLTWLRSAPGR